MDDIQTSLEIQTSLYRATYLLADEPLAHWAGWVTYFLEMLDKEARKQNVAEIRFTNVVLDTVSEAITKRQETNQWNEHDA